MGVSFRITMMSTSKSVTDLHIRRKVIVLVIIRLALGHSLGLPFHLIIGIDRKEMT